MDENIIEKITLTIRYFFANVALKIFKDEYKLLRCRLDIKTQEEEIINVVLDNVVMKDHDWHNISFTVNFWAKKEKEQKLYFDGVKIEDKY